MPLKVSLMNSTIHLDMEKEIQEELRKRQKQQRVPEPSWPTVRLSDDDGTLLNASYGPRQVESLLRYAEDPFLNKALKDADNIADAMHHLKMLKKDRVVKKKKKKE